MPAATPPQNMTTAVAGYQGESPSNGKTMPADISVPMTQPPLFLSCGTEAIASELMTVPTPMNVNSRPASKASRPSSSFAICGTSVPNGPIRKIPEMVSITMSERIPR